MKYLKYISILILGLIILSPGVNAEVIEETTTTIELMEQDFIPYTNVSSYTGCVQCGLYLKNKYIYNNWDKFYSDTNNKEIFDTLYQQYLDFRLYYKNTYDSNFDDALPGTYLSVIILSNSNEKLDLFGVILTGYNKSQSSKIGAYDFATMYMNGTYYNYIFSTTKTNITLSYTINESTFYPFNVVPHYDSANPFVVGTGDYSSTWYYLPTTNFIVYPIKYSQAENTIFKIYNTNSELIKTVEYGDEIPALYKWGDFDPDNQYTTINLDNYYHVLLSLKDYSKTEAFSSKLKVKGMVGITPVYDYGSSEKSTNPGDRCNLTYPDFTDYRLYILKEDLERHSFYYVKSCSPGSSIKVDNTLFDITYVTDDNVDDPVVVIDGQEYHVIPYDKLSWTATDNEQNNVVPGESENIFDSTINNVSDNLESIWGVITTFMSLVTKFFNTLPAEIRAISITTFTTMCVLGIIKIIKF